MNIMEIQNVQYAYDGKKNVLKGVNAQMEQGRMYAILGPSGCGKTTLLSLLGGLDNPSSGQILYQGEDIAKTGLANHRSSHVAFIFQSYNLIDYLTPMENVALTSKLPPLPILEQLGLTAEEAKRNVLKLSGGQQQRVAIVRALASDAQVLLADEPTGNLDEDTAAEITAILKDSAHKSGKCVVIVTHSNELAKEADVVFQLRKGELQILSASNIEETVNQKGWASKKNKR
jgi:putative ABC transport system ATP-binding protein